MDAATDVRANSFADDPAYSHVIPEEERRRPANLRFYERHGFRVEREVVALLGDRPTHWTMIRPAGSSASPR